MKSLLLLSGGLDSLAVLYWKRPHLALTIDYGQRAAQAEIDAATSACRQLGIAHVVQRVHCFDFGIGIMSRRQSNNLSRPKKLSPEWWPYRNQMLVTLAATRAIAYGYKKVLIGTVITDRAHLDGTPEVVGLLAKVLAAQEGKIILDSPAIDMTTESLIRRSRAPRSLLAWAHSCHVSDFACGRCRGCVKHFGVLTSLGWK